MKLVYFAWVRERVSKPEEEIEPPAGVATVADLIAWLRTRGEDYEHAFENGHLIRAAIDKAHVKHDASIAGAREIAFFPPMTGG
jgi:molybdopterin synthase sulfur carrier subunit